MAQSRTLLGVLLAATALIASAPVAGAQERYGQRPPVVISPDLNAPWVMQFQTPRHIQRPAPRTVSRDPLPGPDRLASPSHRNHGMNHDRPRRTIFGGDRPQQAAIQPPPAPTQVQTDGLHPMFLPQEVAYHGGHKPGTIVIDTNDKFLYLVGDDGTARRYGVGVGKPGFEWAGQHRVSRKAEWPGWTPPPQMIKREAAKGHYLPAHMPGGPNNPLGARALYLGSTLYRIHGTNQPTTIGRAVSSGCIRMRNQDVMDLYERVPVGTNVIVM